LNLEITDPFVIIALVMIICFTIMFLRASEEIQMLMLFLAFFIGFLVLLVLYGFLKY